MDRCKDCNHNFVSEKDTFCLGCNPLSCEECGKKVSKYYHRKDIKIPYAYNKVCRECLVKMKVSYFKPEGRYPENNCKECTNVRVLNEAGYCAECHAAMNKYEGTQTCLNCDAYFIPTQKTQLLCTNCTPECSGCGKKFNPSSKTEHLCDSCNFKAGRGSGDCARCEEYSTDLNENAQCYHCSMEPSSLGNVIIFCPNCKTNKISRGTGLCESCKTKKLQCPECFKDMNPSEYICKKCYAKRIS